MKANADQPKAPESKSGSKPKPKDDLKSFPMPEVEKKLESSKDGLTQAEAKKRLADRLQDEGAKSFVKPWQEVMACIASKSKESK